MTNPPRPAVHHDFRLIERDGGTAEDLALRAALRAAYGVPKDTFVTADIPLLLTRLAAPRERC